MKVLVFDTETTGLNPLTAELVGVAFSWEISKGFYVPFPEDKTEAQELIEIFRPFFENEHILFLKNHSYLKLDFYPFLLIHVI